MESFGGAEVKSTSATLTFASYCSATAEPE
jgi:hypothetical protein